MAADSAGVGDALGGDRACAVGRSRCRSGLGDSPLPHRILLPHATLHAGFRLVVLPDEAGGFGRRHRLRHRLRLSGRHEWRLALWCHLARQSAAHPAARTRFQSGRAGAQGRFSGRDGAAGVAFRRRHPAYLSLSV